MRALGELLFPLVLADSGSDTDMDWPPHGMAVAIVRCTVTDPTRRNLQ
jgi:hypothetical protein